MTTTTLDLLSLGKEDLSNWFKLHDFYNNPYVIKLKEVNDYSDFELDKILNVHYQLSLSNFRNEINHSNELDQNQILLNILIEKVKERLLFEKHRNSRYFSNSGSYNFLKG